MIADRDEQAHGALAKVDGHPGQLRQGRDGGLIPAGPSRWLHAER
jgi:hypothetical protein